MPNPVVDAVKAFVNAMMDRMMDTTNFMMIIANCWFQYLVQEGGEKQMKDKFSSFRLLR